MLVGMPLSVAAKCPDKPPRMGGYPGVWPAPNPIAYVIDGRQFTKAELDTLSGDSVEAIHIMCWNPADSTFTAAAPGTGVNVVRIMTRGLVDRLVAELYQAEAASRSQATPREIGAQGATADEVVVELNADKTEWSATLKRGAMVHRCVLDVSGPSSRPASEVQRRCAFSIAEGEKHILSTERIDR